MAMEKSVMVVGIDDSDFSYYALDWTLQHFFSSPQHSYFKLIVVCAKPPPIQSIGIVGPGAVAVMPYVDNSHKITERVVKKVTQICFAKSLEDVEVEAVEGDPRTVLCESVEKHNASVLVVGSHGYGAIKRAVLGSVSDYCAHHAHCSVMIVKKPKH